MSTGVYIISAPSGSGKTTLVERLLREVPQLLFSISYTTRSPRGNEEHGKDYFFVSREEFEKMIKQQGLLEWAEVFGNYYGTSKRFLEEARQTGRDLLLDIDIQGARQVKGKLPEAVTIFILPPSRQVLEQRLRSRSQDAEPVIARRLENARREIHGYVSYDYVLINAELEESVERLRSVVLSERSRRNGIPAGGTAEALRQMQQIAQDCRTERLRQKIRPILESFGG